MKTAKQEALALIMGFIKSDDFIKPMSKLFAQRITLSNDKTDINKLVYKNINAVKDVCNMLVNAYKSEEKEQEGIPWELNGRND